MTAAPPVVLVERCAIFTLKVYFDIRSTSLISDPLTGDDFRDSMVIFDDIDVISNKKHRDAVYNLLNALLETGRHTKTSVFISNHLPTAGKDTRRVLNEAHSVIWFPHSGSGVGMKRLLCDYLGLDKDINKKLRKMK